MKIKSILCIFLCTVLLCGCGAQTNEPEPLPTPEPYVAPNYPLSADTVSKTEAVYINLRADGTVAGINVTDHLHAAAPQVRVEDMSDLSGITDVKTFSEPVLEGGKMFWDMESTELYYSGQSSKTPPVALDIRYSLDGTELPASELAGKGGHVEIKVSVKNLLTNADGLSVPLLFVGGMILPEDEFTNVKAENAVVLGDGAHKIALFLGVPGMEESLKLSSLDLPVVSDSLSRTEYSLSADTEDFALGNMMFAVLPFSSLSAVFGEEAVEGIEGVQTVLSDLESVLSALSGLDAAKLISLLYGESAQLQTLLSAVSEAAALYNENQALLDMLDRTLTAENVALLEKTVSDLRSIDESNLQTVLQSEELSQLMALLGTLEPEATGELSMDMVGLLPLIEELKTELANENVQAAVQALPQTVSRLRSLLATVKSCRGTLDELQALFGADTLKTLGGIMDTAQKYAALGTLDEAQAQSLSRRVREWLALGQSYDIFTGKTESMTSSVLFVFKTEAV